MEQQNYGFVFNEIIIDGNIFIKKSKNEEGSKKIQNEILFYKKIKEERIDFTTPKLIDYNLGIIKLEYIPLSDTLTSIITRDNTEMYIEKILKELSKLHCHTICVNANTIRSDSVIEFHTKIITRYQQTNWDDIHIFNMIKYVNGVKIKNIYEYVDKIQTEALTLIPQFYSDKYSLIHGDPHAGNILIDKEDKIYFIDPRGFYGNTLLYGLAHYDYAKLLFGLSGYSEFDTLNINELSIQDNNLNIDFITQHEDIFCNQRFDRLTIIIALSIWLGNNSTFINNNKKIISIMTAFYLCEKYLY
jgi:tRNA A-37 threonylcarbamoyl transferase component Bud32